MRDEDQLTQIKASWPRPEGLTGTTALANEAIEWLVGEVERKRAELWMYKTALEVIETRAASALNAGVQVGTLLLEDKVDRILLEEPPDA